MEIKYYLVSNRASVQKPMLIGKSRAGWPFLFHAIDEDYDNPFTEEPIHTFGQWRSVIEKAVRSGKAVIMDEFDEEISPEIFFGKFGLIDGYRFSQD